MGEPSVITCHCACGKRAVGTTAQLQSAGWRWSAAFRRYLCRPCFDGVLKISKDRDRKRP